MGRWQSLCLAGLVVVAHPALAVDAELVPMEQAPPLATVEQQAGQPAIRVEANGDEIATVKTGRYVNFAAAIDVPPGAGFVVKAEWDFDGKDEYPVSSRLGGRYKTVIVTARHRFTQPGTYFPALRVYSQSHDGTETPFARVHNPVRVIVEE